MTRGAIVLMEDTAPAPHAGDSWIVRSVDEYVAALRVVGYRLTLRTYLGLRMSRAGYNRIVSAFAPLAEGARPSLPRSAAISAWIAVAAPLDTLVPENADLTKMVFERA